MINLTAFAVRNAGRIEITVSANLPSSCHRAIVNDIYPGGNIVYFIDPGEAQVFIREWLAFEDVICTAVLVPWMATVSITSDKDKVSFIVGSEKVLTIDVLAQNDQFNVWELTGGIVPADGKSFSIFPDTDKVAPVWTKRFGPDTYRACSKWIVSQMDEKFFVFAGGGSGSPRGIF